MSQHQLLLLEMRSLETERSRTVATCVFIGCWLFAVIFRLQLHPWAVVLPLLVISVSTDMVWKFIPNWLTGTCTLLAFCIAAWAGGVSGIVESFKGFSITFAVSLILYARFGLGAGDVKLCACLGACMGPSASLSMLLWAYSLSGILPLCRIAWSWMQPVIFYCLSRVGMKSTAEVFYRSDIDEYLRRQQPMAGWFAAGTFLTFMGAKLI